jgi:hypothetical protein
MLGQFKDVLGYVMWQHKRLGSCVGPCDHREQGSLERERGRTDPGVLYSLKGRVRIEGTEILDLITTFDFLIHRSYRSLN